MSSGLISLIKREVTWRAESFRQSRAKWREGLIKRKMIAFYRQFIRPGDLCFDVGANVGNRTEIFLALGARVICIDPQPGCLSILGKKYGNNPRVVIVPKGVAAQPGEMTLSVCRVASTISTFSEKWKTGRFHDFKWDASVKVPMTTLDALIDEFGCPGFCKIDVEGFEHEVLKGLSRRIPIISFEFAKEFLGDLQSSIEHLTTLGEAKFNFAIGESPRLARSGWGDSQSIIDELERNHDDLLWGDVYVRFSDGLQSERRI